MEIPAWFTDEIAEAVMGKKKYGRLYQREYDDVYYQTRDPIAAMQWAEKSAFAYAYGYFIGYARVILNDSLSDQKNVKKLTRITGQSAEALRNLIAENNKNHPTEDRESRLRKATHSLPEDDLANLWNQCLKAGGYKDGTPLRKTSDLNGLDNLPLGTLFRLYGRVFM